MGSGRSTWHGSQNCGNDSLEMRLGHFHVEKIQNDERVPQGAPESPMVCTVLTDTVLPPLHRNDCGYRVDDWYFPSVALTEGFRDRP